MKKRMSLMLFFTATLIYACIASPPPGNKNPFRNHTNAVVLQWNIIAYETMKTASYDPMLASRIFAMVHIAMHDALNGIAPVYETYSLQQQDKKADPVAALSAAAYTVLVETFPAKREQLDRSLAEAIKDVRSAEARERGLALGTMAGKEIVALRKKAMEPFSIRSLRSTTLRSPDYTRLFRLHHLFTHRSGLRCQHSRLFQQNGFVSRPCQTWVARSMPKLLTK